VKYEKNILDAILRKDFSSFISKVFYCINPGAEYHANWHIDLIADYLEAVRLGEIKRLIINMPPRALKSVCVSVAFPAWCLAHDPAFRVMAASYSSVLSIKHSMDCRLVLSSEWYRQLFPETILSKKHNQKSKFLTSENGFRFATSVGGSATGEGGDLLIIDDPHNPTQINSLTYRSKVIEWFEQTFASRLNNKNKGAIVLVMQRLHEDDLSGHLLNSSDWELLKIPAMSERDLTFQIMNKEYLYKKGELLNKNRDKLEFLDKLKQEIGANNYAAQFLQSPVQSQYNLLSPEDIFYYENMPEKFDFFVQSWDTAIKVSEKADYSVGTCWGVLENKYYLIDMVRRKMAYPELKSEIEKQASKYNPKYLLIEDKASGQSIIQDLTFAGFTNIKPIKPRLDKVTRFASIVPIFQSGRVLLPAKASMNRQIISEITTFPSSHHDDITDSISQFLNFTKELSRSRIIRVRGI